MGTWMEINNLSHSFGKKLVLRDISFSMEEGKITGLLGPSGAGKTTLINLLTGQVKPESGEIRINGESSKSGERSGSRERSKKGLGIERKRVNAGIMMDSFGLYERLSVWDNLEIFARIYGVSKERIDLLLEQTGLLEAKRTQVGRLSKGMRGRVNFCRALLPDAPLLFLDEPSSGLDPATAELLYELILAERERGRAVLLTTHNMQEAQRLCDKILLLNEGRIVEYGTPGELCRKYCFENKIEVVLKNGELHMLSGEGGSGQILADWMSAGEVFSIHSGEPDLEKVFLHLTGRRLNV